MELSQLRLYCEQHDIPLITQTTEDFLRKHIADNQPQHVIEIGSAVGYSSSVIAESLQQYHSPDDTISLISWEISYPHYWQALRQRQYHFVSYFL